MGVPKFYRWLSERYPKINQVITDAALLPEFDHLYLDMNGIIHGCTHPSHLDVSDMLSEKDMMLGIMNYIDRIITQIVKPKVSVFMAIDGVAPRAKLNQQRSRRFRSAKELAEAMNEKKGKTKPTAAVIGSDGADDTNSGTTKQCFDSNCITPGTEFMDKVSNCIKYFIRKKIKEDPLWRNLKVIFSGHEVPGEGEHKIMQHIRDMRNQPGYQPNNRHCMYGQDADLIMLGLVSHEPHFTLLREIVEFGGFDKNPNSYKAVKKFTKQSDFQLLHLSILREYLSLEFCYGLENESDLDLERIIDDWVFMTFLVGNDFLPHMPSLDIGDGAFDLLFDTYRRHRLTWGNGQYLTMAGEISDAARLEAFIKDIGEAETAIFEQREIDEAKYVEKKRRWDKRDGKAEGPSDEAIAMVESSKHQSYMTMIQNMVSKNVGKTFVDGWMPPTEPGAKDFKGRYYYEKLQLTPVDIEKHHALRKAYMEGLIWCLAYYYKGCISWGWFYPYHYGPMLSDLTNLTSVFDSIVFDKGAPLKPFEQLMGCLPPASSDIVPRPYRKLMLTADSPIIDFYPSTFEIDMNGKKNPWEGVNLLPFIDVVLLKETIAKYIPDKLLSSDEKRRNTFGNVYCFSYDPAANETIPSCNRDIGLPDIMKCNSKQETFEEPENGSLSFKPELIKGTQIPYPGFPSLFVLPIQSVERLPIGLNCFGTNSKYPTTVLHLQNLPDLPGADQLADHLLGKSLFINWPMMHEAKVVAVSDARCIVRRLKGQNNVRIFDEKDSQKWEDEAELMREQYLNGFGVPGSGGVNIGRIQIRLKLVPLQGMKTSTTDGSKKKVFGKDEADVPLQMGLFNAPAPDPRFIERGPMTLGDRFPTDANVILTKGKYRGCLGKILNIVDNNTKIGVRVSVVPPDLPFGLAIAKSIQESYVSGSDAAKVLKIRPSIFNKITGSLVFNPGKHDIGLNLKYKQEFCVLGYTKKILTKKVETKQGAWGNNDTLQVVGNQNAASSSDSDENKNQSVWEYTPNTIRLVAAYRQKFPRLFAALNAKPHEKFYEASDLGSDGSKELSLIKEWLNSVDTAKLPRTPITTEAMPSAAVAAVERAADVRFASNESNTKETNIKVPPSALYLEGSTAPTDVLKSSTDEAPELGMRVVNLCANGVPFGARGTIIGIHHSKSGCVEVVMDEEFIGGSTLQGMCSNFRGKLCLWNHLLKISAADSMDYVEKIVPSVSLNANRDKKSSPNDHPIAVEAEPSQSNGTNDESNKKADVDNTRGSNKLAWKEAGGPAEKGIGFKGAGRGGKTGLNSWKSMLKSNGPTGVSKATVDNSVAEATLGLKALLGVGNGNNKIGEESPKPVPVNNDASAGLKSLLGVTSSSTERKPMPVSAADTLLQLMLENAPIQQPYPSFQPQMQMAPKFNFTYVKEGESSSVASTPMPTPVPIMMHNQYPYPVMYPGPMPMNLPMTPVNNAPLNYASVVTRSANDTSDPSKRDKN